MGQAKQRGTFEQRKAGAISLQSQQEHLREGVRNSTQANCMICGSHDFVEVFTVRRISPLYTPTKTEAFFKDERTLNFKCLGCGASAGRRKDEQPSLPQDSEPLEGGSTAGDNNRNVDSTLEEPAGRSEDDNAILGGNSNEG